MHQRVPWFRLMRDLPQGRRFTLLVLSFLVPVAAWCLVSYAPFVWHPMRRVTDPGSIAWLTKDQLVDADAFETANQQARSEGHREAYGTRANPVFLPAPHQVPRALVTG